MGNQALPKKTLSRMHLKWGTLATAGMIATSLGAVGSLSGCAVSESDVLRWERTERGPFKLVAVVTHDKYSWELRTESALALIDMPPRGGRRQGISYLCDKYKDEEGEEKDGALAQLDEASRTKIVAAMAPTLIQKMGTPPPTKKADGTMDPDTSIPYKDAAFAMLSHEPTLVSDPKTRDLLVAALTAWVQTDFDNRLGNTTQQYGLEQSVRFIGSTAVRTLPTLLNDTTSNLDKIASLISDLGDADTKQKASDNLVALAKSIDSAAWVAKQRPIVEDADKRGGQTVTPAQIDAQVKTYQDQKLTSIFGAMKKIGGRSIVEYALAYGADAKNSEDRRKGALAALEGRVDKSNQGDIDRLYTIAKDDNAPDGVRDLAFQRLGELPKEIIVPKLYALFESKKWKVRWEAGSMILKTMQTKDVPQFMSRLPQSASTKMGLSEATAYGGGLIKLEGTPKARDVVVSYLNSPGVGPRLSALGAFYNGTKADQSLLTPHENDSMPVPKCDKDDDCGWSCDVPKPGTQDTESKTIVTVGDFVKYCVEPSLTK